MSVQGLARLFRTVRHLRPSQLLWRARYGLDRRWNRSRPPTPPDLEPFRRDLRARSESFPDVSLFHRAGPVGEAALDGLARGEFTHLNRTFALGRDRPDWRLGEVGQARLWTITLHYHEWAYALAEIGATDPARGDEALDLLRHYLEDWIERCDVHLPGARALAWNSFAIATRIGWWIRMLRLLSKVHAGRWPDFERRVLESLWRQAAFLHEHLEWDLRANHLMRDVVGLAWAGRFFDGPRARRWLATATRLADEQLEEQVLADGAHFERSPMYHLHVMEDVLSLALLLQDEPTAARVRQAWEAMARYADWVRYDDEEIPLFNDAAQHAVCSPGRMLDLGARIGHAPSGRRLSGGRYFDGAGLVVWRGDPWLIFFDVGAVGPDCQPGHAHADSLSIECAHAGARLFVDPGTHGYDDDDRRVYDRSTGAHNTVRIAESDSSEVWHIFRVGRRARIHDVDVRIGKGRMQATAAHDGYRHLEGRPRHRRSVVAADGGVLRVTDSIEGRGIQRIDGGVLVEPQWRVERRDDGWRLERPGAALRVTLRGPAEVVHDVTERPYHPEYGVERLAPRLEWCYEGPLPVELVLEVVPEPR